MKILETKHIREADQYTIQHEPVRSVDLMERAANQLYLAFESSFPPSVGVSVFAGSGNNGGDGIALARKLAENNHPVHLWVYADKDSLSPDSRIQADRLPDLAWLEVSFASESEIHPLIPEDHVVIDALFGSGLNRPPEGRIAELIRYLNQLPNTRVAVDIPSGLFGEDNQNNPLDIVFRADLTWSLHCPKLSMLVPDYQDFVGEWTVLDIGLDRGFVDRLPAAAFLLTPDSLTGRIRKRQKFAHKGDFGHALLIGGSTGKSGAILLAAHACLRSGAGLVTCHTHRMALPGFLAHLPEIMLSPDPDPDNCTELPPLEGYHAVAAGPGLGTGPSQELLIRSLLDTGRQKLVLDADALNVLARHPEWLADLPEYSILTPHPGEFRRLFGSDPNPYERIRRLKNLADQYRIIIVLKGAHTAIALPGGKLWFNTTGNPGMATAGSGDVLTGIVLSLLAQGMDPSEAALTAVYVHGRAGDLAAAHTGEMAVMASDLIHKLGVAFNEIISV